jgi:2-polyprenyl-6-methoxyphenol hydroxylase-like FAD-dependent oxidoreductase
MDGRELHTTCCIVGGGPAGMMTGFLLARAGIDVIVLEKHKDFFRDFRGDTIHPSTFQLMYELGLLEDFLRVPHQEISSLSAIFNGHEIHLADFSHLKVARPAIGLMPQWDFLNFLAGQAARYRSFSLIRQADVTGLLKHEDKITGIIATTPDGPLEVHAKLVIGTDGRQSTVRREAGLSVIETGSPIDVLWFRLSRHPADPGQILGNFSRGRILILLDRNTYWQCGYVIDKDGYDQFKAEGLDKFRADLAETSPFLKDRLLELRAWTDVQLLSVKIDHLHTWYREGLICIGDAAHAMSPVGGVGINLAIQDAVAAANFLWQPLRDQGDVPLTVLARLQIRRAFPTRVIQALQVRIQRGISTRRKATEKTGVPLIMRWAERYPFLRRIPARLVGIGIRPEHVHSPEIRN